MNNRVSTSKKSFAINVFATFGTRLISITVLIWLQQFLIKRIPIEEYSLLPIVFSLLILLPFINYILMGGIHRYVMDAYANHQDDRITNIISSMFPFFLLGGGLLLSIGILLSWQIDNLLNIESQYVDKARLMLMLIVMLEVIRLITGVFSNGIFVKQRFVLESIITISCEIFRIILLFVFLFGFSVSVLSVVAANVISGLAEVIILVHMSLKLLPEQKYKLQSIDWTIVKKILSFGGWTSLYGFSQAIRKSADPIILNRLSTPLDVTCFHLGSLVPNRLEVLINNSFLGSISPIVIGLNAQKQEDSLQKLYLRGGRLLLWGVLLIILPFVVHYEQITILYVGDNFSSAGLVLLLLLSTYPFVYGTVIERIIAKAKKRMRSLAIRETLSAVINIALTLLFVGWYQLGAIGSAMATFLVYGIGYVIVFIPFGKAMMKVTWMEIWNHIFQPGLIPFLVAMVFMKILLMFEYAQTWGAIAFNYFVGGIIYLTMVWLVSKDTDKSEFRAAILSLFSRFKVN